MKIFLTFFAKISKFLFNLEITSIGGCATVTKMLLSVTVCGHVYVFMCPNGLPLQKKTKGRLLSICGGRLKVLRRPQVGTFRWLHSEKQKRPFRFLLLVILSWSLKKRITSTCYFEQYHRKTFYPFHLILILTFHLFLVIHSNKKRINHVRFE